MKKLLFVVILISLIVGKIECSDNSLAVGTRALTFQDVADLNNLMTAWSVVGNISCIVQNNDLPEDAQILKYMTGFIPCLMQGIGNKELELLRKVFFGVVIV